MEDDVPYLLLTPGPLTTSPSVRAAMLRDHGTWDVDYNTLVNRIRARIVRLATGQEGFTSVLVQGSGTFAVEAALGSLIPPLGKVLVIDNGAYGQRMAQIAGRLGIGRVVIEVPETEPVPVTTVERILRGDPAVTHVALVHCETTTGLLNPAAEIGRLARQYGKVFVLDAMSSFGGLPFSMESVGADCLISSANKCIQGVPGFGFVVARRDLLEQARGWARSLSLDLYDQWREMELHGGKWRYTSPTHAVAAFAQALDELDAEGGVAARHRRYSANQERLLAGMAAIGFKTLLDRANQSPIITTFLCPSDSDFSFPRLYDALKARRYLIYPGKVTNADTFRIGTIGHVFPADFERLTQHIQALVHDFGWRLGG